MIPQKRTVSSLTNDINGIAEAQTASGAGDLTLDGVLVVDGVAILLPAQIISIASVDDDTGVVFTVTGTNESGVPITEDITGVNAGTATGTLYFSTVTSVYADGVTADDVTVGVLAADGGVSNLIALNNRCFGDFNVGMSLQVTGTLSATVQTTADDIFDADINPMWFDLSGLTAVTANDVGNIAFAVRGVRLRLNSWTDGEAILNLIQAG